MWLEMFEILLIEFYDGSLANLSTVWDIVEFSFEATHVR